MRGVKIKGLLKWIFVASFILLLAAVAGGGYLFITARASLPALDGEVEMEGLASPVAVASDQYGIPVVSAESRLDAVAALGYLTARDRLFQMDLLRRGSAGTLAEVLGAAALEVDIRQRHIGLSRLADRILPALPEDQKAMLRAYARGVNRFIARMEALPIEFFLLGHRPVPWRERDSLLVVLGMFQMLSWSEEKERMLTVMNGTLPPEVVSFLTPETDRYTVALLQEEASHPAPIPVDALVTLLPPRERGEASRTEPILMKDVGVGSNAWAVNRFRTADGRAILANDMHLGLSVPNIWYRAEMRYDGIRLAGVTLPGVPVMVAGTNGRLAWGITNTEGDFLDLVRLEINPQNRDEYRTPEGWKPFERRRETIRVKGERDVQIEVQETVWGPVAQNKLLGEPVAIRWIAYEPGTVNLALFDMDRAATVGEGIATANRAGAPPSNVIFADDQGRIAWTIAGKLPIRRGFDGSVSLSWKDGTIHWEGFIPPDKMPRIIDPPSGILASANQRMLGKEDRYMIGRNFPNGYRAYWITERLRAMADISEKEMLALQLDTTSLPYRFYQKLALDLLTEEKIRNEPLLSEAKQALAAWNGRAEVDSAGFGILVAFRENLARSVFAPFLRRCLRKEPGFGYGWSAIDIPLQRLLTEKIAALHPDPAAYPDWDTFVLGRLEESAGGLKKEYGVRSLTDLSWGRMNLARISHPLGGALPGMHLLLDMPSDPLPGCSFCIRVVSGAVSASERLVISPGRPQEGFLHMPGGQSGHPFSPHYRDQQEAWVAGEPLPFLAGPPRHRLTLVPARHSMSEKNTRS